MSELLVKSATHKIGHILEILFSDGHVSTVDFAPFIYSSGHSDYDKYKSIATFTQFDIVDGNLNWDDYTMILPVEHLYTGLIRVLTPFYSPAEAEFSLGCILTHPNQ
jgi:hypothetical protein